MENTNTKKFRTDPLQPTIYEILPESDWGFPAPEIETIKPEEIDTGDLNSIEEENRRISSKLPQLPESA